MKNDVLEIDINKDEQKKENFNESYEIKHIQTSKDCDYSTFHNEMSIVLTENTAQFDLYKGFFYVFIACLFKSVFSLLCKFLLEKNKTITSFHLLAYKVYIMLALTFILSLFILYVYYSKNKNKMLSANCMEKDSFNSEIEKNKFKDYNTNITNYSCSDTENNLIEKKYIQDKLIKNENEKNPKEEIEHKLNYYDIKMNEKYHGKKIREENNRKECFLTKIFYLEDSESLVFDMKRRDLFLVGIRSIFAILSISLGIFGLQHLNISNFFSVYYIYPALVIVLSYLTLKEKVGDSDYICLISCFIGMIFIIRPEFFFEKSSGDANKSFYFIVILSAIFKSLEDIIVRNIGKDIHFLMIPFMYSLIGIILYPSILFFAIKNEHKVEMSFSDCLILFLIAVCSFAYQSFMALGIQNEKAGRASMINYLQVPLMFIIDLILFNKPLVMFDIIGTFIIFIFNFGNSFFIVAQRNNTWKKFQGKNSNFH